MHALVFTAAYAPHRPPAMLNVGRCGRTGVATTFVNKNQDDTQQQGRYCPHFYGLQGQAIDMGVSKNRGTPKWMVKIMGNPPY